MASSFPGADMGDAMTLVKVFGWYVAIALTVQVGLLAAIVWGKYCKKKGE